MKNALPEEKLPSPLRQRNPLPCIAAHYKCGAVRFSTSTQFPCFSPSCSKEGRCVAQGGAFWYTGSMEQYKKEFIDFMVSCQVLKFGSFTLKSGRQSPFFMNAGGYVTGGQLSRLGTYYAQAIHANFGDDIDVFFGPAYKGIPLAVVTAVAYSTLYGKEIKYCCDRKEEKDHGADKGAILGYKIKDGDRVVIIEDVTTSGKSIAEVYPKIKAMETSPGGIHIVGEIVSLNRQERAPDSTKSALSVIEETYGFPARAIVDMDDVVQALYTGGDRSVITDEIKSRLDAYYKEWGCEK